jgi:hypothetical protein
MATRRDSGIDSITFSTKEGSVELTKEDEVDPETGEILGGGD